MGFLKADILLKISNQNWSLSYCLNLPYINFFGSKFCFENSVHHMIMATQTKGIYLHK